MPEEKKKYIWDANDLKGVTFEGTITRAVIEEQDYAGGRRDMVILTIAPDYTDREITIRWPYSEYKNSIHWYFLTALKKCDVSIQSEQDLIGARFLFQRTDLSFGPNIEEKKDFPLPYKFLGKGTVEV